jgi:hypothetical protein
MSNDEYQQQQFWITNQQVKWIQEQEKLVSIRLQEDLEKWFVATSPCPTVEKLIKEKNDKTTRSTKR